MARPQEATFAAGCFWSVEQSFRQTPGVLDAEVGYTGGHTSNPTYEEVCQGDTGHAEAIHVRYDPDVVTYQALVDLFFAIHDPTTPNRQGPDVGHQYRSAIFVHDDAQESTARDTVKRLNDGGRFLRPIVTEIARATVFWRAEEYHQQYLAKQRRVH